MKPEKYLDLHEKFLIGVATKGGNGFLFCFFGRDVWDCYTLFLFTYEFWFYLCIGGVSVVKLFNAVSCFLKI